MRKLIFSNTFGYHYSTFLGFPKSQQENMAISGGKIENGALSRWRLGIKWVLKHILILKFSYINISLGIFFVFTTLRYSQRQKSFIPKFYFQAIHLLTK